MCGVCGSDVHVYEHGRIGETVACGATTAIHNREGALADADRDFDVLIECTGHAASTQEAILHVRPAGRAILVGMSPHASMALPLAPLQSRKVEIVGTFRFANTYERCLRVAASGRLRLDEIANAAFHLAHVGEALGASRRDEQVIKAVDYPNP